MKKFKFLTLLFVSLLSVSCLVDDEDTVLDNVSNTPYVVGFSNAAATESYFSDLGSIETNYTVSLIGGQDGTPSTSPFTINYSINNSLSTAMEGVEFDFVSNTGSVEIPANSTFGTFGILVNTGNFDPNQPTTLVVDLEAVNGAAISSKHERLTITFVGCQSQLNTSMYSCVVTRDDGAVFTHGVQDIRLVAPNTFKTRTTGGWQDGQLPPPDQGFVFSDVCGELSMDLQNLMDFYSNEVDGLNASGPDGSVDANGNFTISYTIILGGEPVAYTNTYTKL